MKVNTAGVKQARKAAELAKSKDFLRPNRLCFHIKASGFPLNEVQGLTQGNKQQQQIWPLFAMPHTFCVCVCVYLSICLLVRRVLDTLELEFWVACDLSNIGTRNPNLNPL